MNKCKTKDCGGKLWSSTHCYRCHHANHALESSLETKAVALAENVGYTVFKFTAPGTLGVPDRIFICDGRVFFVEFKKKGGTERVSQDGVINDIRKNGGEVHVIDNLKDFKKLL